MLRSSALCIALGLSACGCSPEIVLGDSEAALPVASGSSGSGAGGAPSSGGAPLATAGSGGNPSSAGGMTDTPPDLPIPPPGDIVWSTDHEVGDFSDWQRGGAYYGGEYEWGDVNGYVDIGVGRDGSNGVVADINTASRGEPSEGVRMYRRIEAGPAYYSAWFRLEDAHTVSDWWSIFLFHARDDALSLDNDVSLWDVRIVDTPGGDMQLQFFDHDVMLGTVAGGPGRIAAGDWFEISAYLDYRPPDATRLSISLNGTQLFDMKGLHTAVQTNVFWSVGNGAAGLDPPDSTLDLDDAAIRKAAAP
jgi:hypothetical protein